MSLFRLLGSIAFASAALVGCGADGTTPLDANDVVRDASAADVATSDAGSSCLAMGSAQLNVMLDTAPGLAVDPSDIWVAAMCLVGNEERPVRVVRADPAGRATTIAGLGPGTYIVRVSALVVPGVASTRIDLRAGATALTSLTLAPGDPPLALLRAMPLVADGGLDAAASDASIDATAAADVIAPPTDSGSDATTLTARIVRTGTTDVIGTAEAMLEPRDSNSFDVTVRVRANDCTSSCGRIGLAGLELRSTHMNEPLGFAVSTFDYDAIAPGYTATSARRTLTGALGDPNLGFAFAVFGTPADTDAGAAVRDR